MKLLVMDNQGAPGYVFWCPGCEENHLFSTDRWQFDGNMESPTFNPSLLYPTKKPRCHLFLHAGKLQFLNDCEHKLAGQTVDLPDYPGELDYKKFPMG